MTYDANRGNGAFHCDTCPESIDTGEDNFRDAFHLAQRKGWRSYKGPDKQYAHACPSCTEDHAKEQSHGRR